MFWQNLYKSEDPFDNLGEFAEYLHRNVGSTGVYIGQLEAPFKNIAEDADEEAHLDKNSPEVIKYKFANADHKELMVGTKLEPNHGLTHKVFSEEVTNHNLGVSIQDKTDEQAIDLYKHKYVPEVVRNKDMYYWKVPRLGSYLAIPMVYKSCLSVSSYTQAVDEYNEYITKKKKQEHEKSVFEEQQAQLQIEKIGAGEAFVPEVREWEKIVEPPIKTDLKKFVVCLDTMGQDREFTKTQRAFALKAVEKFKKYWEQFELKMLTADREALINEKAEDEANFSDEVVHGFKEKEDNMVENKLNPPKAEEGKDDDDDHHHHEPVDLEKRNLEIVQMKLKFQIDLLKDNPNFKKRFDALTTRKVVKHHKLLKCIFYLLEYDSEKICVDKTQQFFWKKARHFWNNELIDKMRNFRFLGPKDHPIKKYQTINYLEKNLEGLSQDSINVYSYALGLIYKWMMMIIDARKKNIIGRLNDSRIKREDRQHRIEEDK
jgi:hypothetical protein